MCCLPNNALERSVIGLAVSAAGARKIVAPAALGSGLARPAQRGRSSNQEWSQFQQYVFTLAGASPQQLPATARPVTRWGVLGPDTTVTRLKMYGAEQVSTADTWRGQTEAGTVLFGSS
jgi:hypothetical protein